MSVKAIPQPQHQSMKLRLYATISYAINLEFKKQPRTFNPHIEREIQIIKFDALRRRQPRE
jgi:hypothetical protein